MYIYGTVKHKALYICIISKVFRGNCDKTLKAKPVRNARLGYPPCVLGLSIL